MAGMEAQTPETIARKAGFPLAGAATPMSLPPVVPKTTLAPGSVAPTKSGPSIGATELIPGQLDWLKNLVLDMLPSRGAQAAPPGAITTPTLPAVPQPAAPGTLGQVSGASGFVGPPAPLAPWYERMGLVPNDKPVPLGRMGVRG